MITSTIPDLVINVLTQAQYDAAVTAGNINEDELYMTTGVDIASGAGSGINAWIFDTANSFQLASNCGSDYWLIDYHIVDPSTSLITKGSMTITNGVLSDSGTHAGWTFYISNGGLFVTPPANTTRKRLGFWYTRLGTI